MAWTVRTPFRGLGCHLEHIGTAHKDRGQASGAAVDDNAGSAVEESQIVVVGRDDERAADVPLAVGLEKGEWPRKPALNFLAPKGGAVGPVAVSAE